MYTNDIYRDGSVVVGQRASENGGQGKLLLARVEVDVRSHTYGSRRGT
jgi:hypothetical protein